MTSPNYNPHSPNEPVMFTTPIGLKSLGSEFNPEAPYSGCRLCGALYQSALDREAKRLLEMGVLYEIVDDVFGGPTYAVKVLDDANARRERWRTLHERRYHDEEEIAALQVTGNAFTPEAANKLAPFGIIPLGSGYDDKDVAAALLDAPRAPLDDPES